VVRRALYGSLAQGLADEDSDVDLLVELSHPLGLEFFALADYLERKLGRKVDLVTLETFRRSLTAALS
jgi:predicted nucleotidyltransferase